MDINRRTPGVFTVSPGNTITPASAQWRSVLINVIKCRRRCEYDNGSGGASITDALHRDFRSGGLESDPFSVVALVLDDLDSIVAAGRFFGNTEPDVDISMIVRDVQVVGELVASSSIDAVEADGDPFSLGVAGLSSSYASLLIWIWLIDWLVDESEAAARPADFGVDPGVSSRLEKLTRWTGSLVEISLLDDGRVSDEQIRGEL